MNNRHLLLIFSGTALSAVFINLAVENFSGWKYAATFSIIQHSYFAGFLVYIIFNLGLVFSSVFIVTQFAPAAAGSGIPEIKGYLNGRTCFTWRTFIFFFYDLLNGIHNMQVLIHLESSCLEHWLERFVWFCNLTNAFCWLVWLCSYSFFLLRQLQIFGSIGSVGGGLALGKEGPLVHTGACIASLLEQVCIYWPWIT